MCFFTLEVVDCGIILLQITIIILTKLIRSSFYCYTRKSSLTLMLLIFIDLVRFDIHIYSTGNELLVGCKKG